MKVTPTGEEVVGVEKKPLGGFWRLNQNDLEMLLKGEKWVEGRRCHRGHAGQLWSQTLGCFLLCPLPAPG